MEERYKQALPELIPSYKLAEILGLTDQAIRQWRLRGEGPEYIKIGGKRGRVLYDVAVVSAWLEGQRRMSTSDTGVLTRLTR